MMVVSKTIVLVVLALVAAVSSQSNPHFVHRGTVLVNNSYVLRGDIGEGHNNSLHCVTKTSECCNNGQGHWYNWTGAPVHNGSDEDSNLYVTRGVGVVYLNRRRRGSSGMWRCDIPDSNGVLQSIFIYTGTTIAGKLSSAVIYYTLDSEANEDPPEFTLTCQSKGGSATMVVWTRDGRGVLEDSNHMTSQIIVDTSSNTVYNNTLRVRGREPGNYRCTVRNDFSSGASATILLANTPNITSLTATYTSTITFLLTWTFNNALLKTAVKYIVYYKLGETSRHISFDLNGNVTNYEVTDYSAGDISNVYLVAISHLPTPVFGPTTLMAESPEVMVSGEGSGVVGTSYTLICRVSLPSGVKRATLHIRWIGISIHTINVNSRVYVYNYTFHYLPVTGTEYTCIASYIANGVSSKQVNASIAINKTYVGELSVAVIGSGRGEVGSMYALICTVTVFHRVSGSSVSIHWPGPSTDQQTINTTNNTVINRKFSLDPLTLGHSGKYTCTANYTVRQISLIRSDSLVVIPNVPPPRVMLRKSKDIILVRDVVVIYCDISLIGVMWRRDVTVDVTWFSDRVPVTTDSRVTVSPVTEGVGGILYSSLTFSSVQLSDMATYQCNVTLTPLLGTSSPVSSYSSISLSIEIVDPVKPENIVFRDVKTLVQWTVPYISYSPETYVVQYGTSRDSLVHNSSVAYSKDGVTSYSVELSGLRANTTYYVEVLSTNTALRSNRSNIRKFTTFDALTETETTPSECPCSRVTDCENAVSAPVIGGILSLIIILIIGVSALTIVILTIKIKNLKSQLTKKEVVVREEVDVDIKSVPTDSNAAYGAVSHGTGSGVDVAMYEIVGQPSSSSSKAKPTSENPSTDLSQAPPTSEYDLIATKD